MQPFLGLIADTHGLLRPEALAALAGADLIIHAGDVGDPQILAMLAAIAPVHAIRGNVDKGSWATALPTTEVVTYRGYLLYVLHDRNDLDLTPEAAGFHAVISGHSHTPDITERNGVLYVNPGGAGPRRFTLPITVGRLSVTGGHLQAEIVELPITTKGFHADRQ
ncbi:MAG TPA: metallophosphoesterase family protein [Caldilineaceae bacterium]|nr:metallophosphoesterase family protein [Caldilineaceae bacterium]